MKPLKSLDSNKTLIESNLVDEIFYTIPEILQHHENFLSALQDRLSSDWDSSQVIGNVFTEAVSVLMLCGPPNDWCTDTTTTNSQSMMIHICEAFIISITCNWRCFCLLAQAQVIELMMMNCEW